MWLLHIGNLVADEGIFVPFVGRTLSEPSAVGAY
jgi:hypothetical protein